MPRQVPALDKEALLKVIDEDAQIRHQYINTSGETCFIGGLLLASGEFTPESLREYMSEKNPDWPNYVRNKCRVSQLPHVLSVLRNHYGLSELEASALQAANDTHTSREVRQRDLRKTLDRL